MADKTIPQLDAVGTLTGGMSLHIIDGEGNSREVTLAEIKAFVNTDPTVVPSSVPWRGARVSRSSDVTGISWPYIVSWNQEDLDTDGIWNIGAPTRLTVPAGVTKVRCIMSIELELGSVAGTPSLLLMKNGSTVFQGSGKISFRNGTSGFTNNNNQVVSAVLEVEEGDYFECRINNTMTGIDELLSGSGTWMEMEIVEASS